jgi:hypothetical protein
MLPGASGAGEEEGVGGVEAAVWGVGRGVSGGTALETGAVPERAEESGCTDCRIGEGVEAGSGGVLADEADLVEEVESPVGETAKGSESAESGTDTGGAARGVPAGRALMTGTGVGYSEVGSLAEVGAGAWLVTGMASLTSGSRGLCGVSCACSGKGVPAAPRAPRARSTLRALRSLRKAMRRNSFTAWRADSPMSH